MFYITTSKGAGAASVKLCESLASSLPRAVFERRGRKTIEGVVARARKLGKPHIIIADKGAIRFMAVSANSWKWSGEEISGGKITAKISSGSISFIIGKKVVGPKIKMVGEE